MSPELEIFDYLEGGDETLETLRARRACLPEWPRTFVGIDTIDLGTIEIKKQ